jgi:hypothetical protein
MSRLCHVCGEPLNGAFVDLSWGGFASSSLNGMTMRCHARCVRLEATVGRDVALPPRLSDPEAEPQLALDALFGDAQTELEEQLHASLEAIR